MPRTHRHATSARTDYAPPQRGEKLPEDYGHRTRRCRSCDAYLCRYHEAASGLCWPCDAAIPGEGGVVIEIDGELRRFRLVGLTLEEQRNLRDEERRQLAGKRVVRPPA